jgi:hypothetical protein
MLYLHCDRMHVLLAGVGSTTLSTDEGRLYQPHYCRLLGDEGYYLRKIFPSTEEFLFTA